MEGAKKSAAEATTELELESNLDSDSDMGGEKSSGESGSIRAEWIGVGWKREPHPYNEDRPEVREGKTK